MNDRLVQKEYNAQTRGKNEIFPRSFMASDALTEIYRTSSKIDE